MRKLFLIFLLSGILLFSVFVLAKTTASDCNQYCSNPATYNPPAGQVCFCNPLKYATFDELVTAIMNFIFVLAVVTVPLIIIVGAFQLLTSSGDPKKIGAGKSMITYALIGLAIILLARGIIAMIQQAIGVE